MDFDTRMENLVDEMRRMHLTLDEALAEFQKRWIMVSLEENGGNQCKTARELGVHRNTIRRTMDRLAIDPWNMRPGKIA